MLIKYKDFFFYFDFYKEERMLEYKRTVNLQIKQRFNTPE